MEVGAPFCIGVMGVDNNRLRSVTRDPQIRYHFVNSGDEIEHIYVVYRCGTYGYDRTSRMTYRAYAVVVTDKFRALMAGTST